MSSLLQDLRFALRSFIRAPRFSVPAILALALGIGATSATLSVVRGVMLEPLPYRDPDRVVSIWETNPDRNIRRNVIGQSNFVAWRERLRSFEHLGMVGPARLSLIVGNMPDEVEGMIASSDVFAALGVQPAIGRAYTANEDVQGNAQVMVVSHEFWRDTLGSPASLDGVALKVFGESVPVAGVMPEGFHFPPDANVWFPADVFPKDLSRTAHNWHAVGRLQDGVTLEQAREEASGLGKALRAQLGGEVDLASFGLTTLHDALVGPVRPILLSLLAGAGFLLLVAGSNVANLFVAQALARRKELAVRAALGAGQGRLVRQFVCESLVLALGGALLGVLAARASLGGMLALIGDQLPRAGEIAIDARTLLATFAVSVALAVLVAAQGMSICVRGRARAGRFRPRWRGVRATTIGGVTLDIALQP